MNTGFSPGRRRAGESDGSRLRILFIDDFLPDPRFGAGTPRAERFLAQLMANGAAVTLWRTGPTAIFGNFEFDRGALNGARLGNETTADLAEFLRETSPFDAVIVSRPHNMPMFRAAAAGHLNSAIIIYDAEALFAARDILMHEVFGAPLAAQDARDRIEAELRLIDGADIVLAVNADTASVFQSRGHRDVRVLSYAVAPNPSTVPFEHRDGFLFVGPTIFNGQPNSDAVVWFADHVVPRLRSAFKRTVSLTVAGLLQAPDVLARAGDTIEPLGVVNDLAGVYSRARVFVAPIRFAAGIPLKVYHAAAHGIPTVITPLLARQVGWTHEQECLVAATPDEFAAACYRLHEDGALWSRIRDYAMARVTLDCNPHAFQRMVEHLVSRIAGARH